MRGREIHTRTSCARTCNSFHNFCSLLTHGVNSCLFIYLIHLEKELILAIGLARPGTASEKPESLIFFPPSAFCCPPQMLLVLESLFLFVCSVCFGRSQICWTTSWSKALWQDYPGARSSSLAISLPRLHIHPQG